MYVWTHGRMDACIFVNVDKCMYARKHVCMDAFMYVCEWHERRYGSMYICMGSCTYVWTPICLYICMFARMDIYLYRRMYVGIPV
jgi:hypothetical protein